MKSTKHTIKHLPVSGVKKVSLLDRKGKYDPEDGWQPVWDYGIGKNPMAPRPVPKPTKRKK